MSGILEAGWIVSLKMTNGFSRLVPTIVYAILGFCAAFLLAQSLKSLPMGAAYAVWTGVSLVGALALDVLLFHEPIGRLRLVCALMIVAGSWGLRAFTP